MRLNYKLIIHFYEFGVQFLSMKLTAASSFYDFNTETCSVTETIQVIFEKCIYIYVQINTH